MQQSEAGLVEPGSDDQYPGDRRTPNRSLIQRSRATRFVTSFHRARTTSTGHRLFWWIEILAIAVFYVVYSTIRNSSNASPERAFGNAKHIIRVEAFIGSFHEAAIQDWLVDRAEWFVIAMNYFYGSLHFIATIAVIVFLYRRCTDDYPRWRNTLAVTTALALVGFTLFPLMPPRLLDPHLGFTKYGFVDALDKYHTFWSFNSGYASKVSNQYAAMPSLHFAWSSWVAYAGGPRVRRTWLKVLLFAYPWVTLTAIVVTANHYWIDAAGGAVIFIVGYIAGRALTKSGRRPRTIVPVGEGQKTE